MALKRRFNPFCCLRLSRGYFRFSSERNARQGCLHLATLMDAHSHRIVAGQLPRTRVLCIMMRRQRWQSSTGVRAQGWSITLIG
ncbi:MAG: hypothetical protein EAZ30_00315 [Betaproteobacteria bacterium]|nr:MAG: hypothetical protein EAZ30_00315 [Betaproteobacteria bacterium]